MDPRLQELLQSLGTLSNAAQDAASNLGILAGQTQAQTNASKGVTDATKEEAKAKQEAKNRALALVGGLSQLVGAAFAFNRAVIQLNSRILTATTSFETLQDRLNLGYDAVGKLLDGFGTLSGALGPLGAVIGGGITKAGQEILEITKAQTTAQVTALQGLRGAFAETNNSFGIVGTTLSEFALIAHSAGLSSRQFGQILSQNAESISEAFGGAGTGSLAMASAMRTVLKDSQGLGRNFRALGMEVPDIAAEIADFASMTRRAGNLQTMTGEELATQSYDYMMTLKGLQAITGEDLKAQKARQRGLMAEAAFRGKMSQVDEETRKKMLAAGQLAERLGPGARRAFIELQTFGEIVSQEGAMYAQAYPQVVDSLRGYSDIVNDSSISAKNAGEALAGVQSASAGAIDAEQRRIADSGMLGMQMLTNNSEFLNTLAGNFTAVSDELPKLQDAQENYRIFLENTNTELRSQDPVQDLFDTLFYSQQAVAIAEERDKLEADSVAQLGKTLKGMDDLRQATTDLMSGFNQGLQEFTNALTTGRFMDALKALTQDRQVSEEQQVLNRARFEAGLAYREQGGSMMNKDAYLDYLRQDPGIKAALENLTDTARFEAAQNLSEFSHEINPEIKEQTAAEAEKFYNQLYQQYVDTLEKMDSRSAGKLDVIINQNRELLDLRKKGNKLQKQGNQAMN